MSEYPSEGRDFDSREVGTFLEKAFGQRIESGTKPGPWQVDDVSATLDPEKNTVVIRGLQMQWGTDPDELAGGHYQARTIVELFNSRNASRGWAINMESDNTFTGYVPLADFESGGRNEVADAPLEA